MNKNNPWIVAVDGPAGSGKSSICRQVCRHIGFSYVNTGAIYRACAYIAKKDGIDIQNENQLGPLLSKIEKQISWNSNTGQLFYMGNDISNEIATESSGTEASKIATSAKLRTALLPLQRKLAKESAKGSLLDGRDIGSVVFPNADLKIYMTASLECRAQRRLSQLREAAPKTASIPSLKDLIEEMEKRDYQDQHRSCAPLLKSSDAVELDTSDLSLDETVTALKSLIENRLGISPSIEAKF